jgi:predicted esterase YcpF (UPF0227 family)
MAIDLNPAEVQISALDYTLIYLHGFNSSPLSKKALQTTAYFESLGIADRLIVPELAYEPAQAMRDLRALISMPRPLPVVLCGSSLGGYYASCLAEDYNLKAVLINPAVRPYLLWKKHLGVNHNYYSGEAYRVTPAHIEQLREIERDPISRPANFLLLAQTGDEVLDYRDAVEKYKNSARIIQQGGDHSFRNYQKMLPVIMNFFATKQDFLD